SNHRLDPASRVRAAASLWRLPCPNPRLSNSAAIRRSVQSECAPRLPDKRVSLIKIFTFLKARSAVVSCDEIQTDFSLSIVQFPSPVGRGVRGEGLRRTSPHPNPPPRGRGRIPGDKLK